MSKPFKFRYANEIAGAFVILALLLFAVGVFMAGRAQGWFEGKFELVGTVESERGSFGLREGAEVWVMDTVAGRISKIEPTGEGRMQATFLIRNRFLPFIRRDAVARVKRKFGVAGDAYVDIDMGQGAPIRDGATIPCRRDEELMETARQVLDEVKSDVLPMLDDVKGILSNANVLTAGITEGDGLAGAALRDNSLRDEVREMLRTVQGLLEESDTAIRETTRLIEGVQRHWLLRKYVEDEADAIVLAAVQADPWARNVQREWERRLAEARLSNRPAEVAHYALCMGYASLAGGDLDAARTWATEARAELRAADRAMPRADLLDAEIARRDGRFREAAALLGSIGEAPRGATREVRAAWQLQQGRLALDRDEVLEAGRALQEAVRELRRVEWPALDAEAAELGGDLARRAGDLEMAADYYDTAWGRLRAGGLFHGMTRQLVRAGDAYAEARLFDLAADRYYRAARSCWASGARDEAEDILASARASADDAGRVDLQVRIEALQGEISGH